MYTEVLDKENNVIHEGDTIAFADENGLRSGKITRLVGKWLEVSDVDIRISLFNVKYKSLSKMKRTDSKPDEVWAYIDFGDYLTPAFVNVKKAIKVG